jgi:ribosomal protein S18 acetylase RimI-like enzyme
MNTRKILLIVLLALTGGGIAYYYSHQTNATQVKTQQGPIFDYDDATDRKDIVNFFTTERHWLLWPGSDFDPEFMLTYKAPDKNPLYIGKLIVKVLREDNKFAGFICYYKKTLTEGMILFLAIKPEFRNKGYGKKLVLYALDDFKRMGMAKVTLLTRTVNYPAQKVYTSLGFVETSRDDGAVYYEKVLH